jgi:hypothetical protein
MSVDGCETPWTLSGGAGAFLWTKPNAGDNITKKCAQYCSDRAASVFDPKGIWESTTRARRDDSVLTVTGCPAECQKVSHHLKYTDIDHPVAHGDQRVDVCSEQCQISSRE